MADDDLQIDTTPGYTAPKKVDLNTLQELDKDDEALNRWKAALLQGAEAAKNSDDPRKVIVTAMRFHTPDHEDLVLDLTGDLSILKDSPFTIKEGCQYRIKIDFKVQNEVVSGLRYVDAAYRKGVRVERNNFMLGSYGPKGEVQTAMTPWQEMPSGMLARGHYKVKSKFIDDDNETHLEWEWSFDLKKTW
eukprot:m.119788 g.119788  ORF g.119788 m.119788 type:complete len:190 (-) comp15480_c0_seq1:190-759(-)